MKGKSEKLVIEYYDNISLDYEKLRKTYYHEYLDEREMAIIKPMFPGKTVLDAGCGTGITLKKVQLEASLAVGVDLSERMLNYAREKSLNVYRFPLDKLDFPDEYFDLVYSFKVLPHIEDLLPTIEELARVTKQNGHLVLGFYNKYSLRYLINKYIKPDKVPYTRYDNIFSLVRNLKKDFYIEKIHGIRLLGLNSKFYENKLFRSIDSTISNGIFKVFSGFVILVLQKRDN